MTVVKQLEENLPEEHIIYVGDTAKAPYGEKTAEQIRQYSREIITFLLEFDVKLVLAACNTSSALALPEIQEEFPVPVVGVIEPGVRAALRHHRKGPIALWATEATVASGVYSQKLKAANPGVETVAVPCPKLVPMIESGRLEEPNLTQVLEEYLEPVRQAQAEILILGCTHYPFLAPRIQALAPELTLIDPAIETVGEARRRLEEPDGLSPARGRGSEYHVSGDPGHFAARSQVLAGKVLQPRQWNRPRECD